MYTVLHDRGPAGAGNDYQKSFLGAASLTPPPPLPPDTAISDVPHEPDAREQSAG